MRGRAKHETHTDVSIHIEFSSLVDKIIYNNMVEFGHDDHSQTLLRSRFWLDACLSDFSVLCWCGGSMVSKTTFTH